MSGPLAGIKVVDLGRVIAAPFCAMLLGDMGADVVKVEPPGGDPVREVRPAFANGMGGYFATVNRNKRSVVLDLRTPKGLDRLRGLLADADVLVENFRPGVLEKMGFTDDALPLARILKTAATPGLGDIRETLSTVSDQLASAATFRVSSISAATLEERLSREFPRSGPPIPDASLRIGEVRRLDWLHPNPAIA